MKYKDKDGNEVSDSEIEVMKELFMISIDVEFGVTFEEWMKSEYEIIREEA